MSPEPEEALLPSFLDYPQPQLNVYPVYAVLAEKFQALVMLGIANSRMKDFYDVRTIANTMDLDGAVLFKAIKATFERRETVIEQKPLYVFSDGFKDDKGKNTQWAAFINKNELDKEIVFSHVVEEIQKFLEPVYQAISEQRDYEQQWFAKDLKWKSQ